MEDFDIYDLTPHEEYSLLCDGCESEETTRDSSQFLALKMAEKEGFIKIGGDVFCPKCAKNQEAK